jgi:chromosome segregation ATPase
MTLGMSAAAEAREQLRSLSSERDYYSQQYAGELSRSSALAQRLQLVQAELTQEQEKEKQESDDHARHLQALQAQVESDQKDMSYQAAWVVQARDKKLQGVQSDAALWKNRSLALEQELKEVRTANKLEKAKEVGMSTKIADLQRQNDALIVDQQDHDQEVNKSQSNLEYAQRQTRQVEKALKQSKQHSLALEAKLQLLQGAQQDWTREHLQDQQDNARLQKILKNAGAYTDRRIQGVITRASKMALGFQSSEQAWVAKEQHFQASLLQANNRIESLQSHLKKQSQKLADEKDQVKKAHAEIKTLHKKAQDLESDADSRQGLEENVDDLEQQNHALENALHTAQTDGGSSRQQLAELQEQNLELSRDLEAAKLQLKHQGAGKYQLALIDLSSVGNTGTKDTNPEAEVNDLYQRHQSRS